MTPSQWEQGRSPAHDLMQADVADFLRQEEWDARQITFRGNKHDLMRFRVDVEFMLATDSGNILGFLDVVEWFGAKDTPRSAEFRWVDAYELKPVISSAGAIIRQVQATELAIERWGAAMKINMEIRVTPIVLIDDPNVPILRRLWRGRLLCWDAAKKVLA